MRWGIKRNSNDELRQKFVDAPSTQAKVLGVTPARPGPEVERGSASHDFGAIDWNEFWNVVNGHGPCNRERLAARVKAWDDGAWVREAALAHAQAQDTQAARRRRPDDEPRRTEWPLWEVFIRSKSGLDHKHCGSLHASDAAMALQMARDVYTRRQEGVSIWVVRSDQIVASDPDTKRHVLRAGRGQGLPPPDLLQAAGRRGPHVS